MNDIVCAWKGRMFQFWDYCPTKSILLIVGNRSDSTKIKGRAVDICSDRVEILFVGVSSIEIPVIFFDIEVCIVQRKVDINVAQGALVNEFELMHRDGAAKILANECLFDVNDGKYDDESVLIKRVIGI